MVARLSVIMPVYNGAAHLSEAVDSILKQTLGSFELLVMDDGSSDDTRVILKRYAEQDRRVRLHLRRHQGQIACRNELLQLARTSIVACADADDICLPDRLETQLATMERESDLWILGTAVISVDAKGARRKRWRMPTGSAAVGAELERRCCIAHPSCMMRVKHILAIGGYRAAYECAEDYDLFLRASELGKVDNLSMVGVLYRQHRASVSRRRSLRQAISTDLARATHFLRAAGHRDPTDGLAAAPALDDPMLSALIPAAQMEFHRAMEYAFDPLADPAEVEGAVGFFRHACIGNKQARAAQRAMLRLVGRRRFDLSSLIVAARAVALGPGRLRRLLLRTGNDGGL
jgi:GT2 family glycosyltransferase